MITLPQRSINFFRFSVLYWLAVLAGVFLWSREWDVVRLASTKQEEDLFGLFGFCVSCAIAFSAYLDFKKQSLISMKKVVIANLPYLVFLIFLTYTIEFGRHSWDYTQYEAAFRAIVAGDNPYLSNRYLYPPLFADLMVFVFRIGLRLFPLLGLGKSAWIFVFYVHQSSILFFLMTSYYLSMRFVSQIGADDATGTFLVSVLYLFNVPILRTLSFNQVNFYVLASVLGALLFLRSHPFLAGLSLVPGGFIKLYSFALCIPLLILKKWRALSGVLAGSILILLIETNFFRTLQLWGQFIRFYLFFPVEQESSLFRNTSPMSFLRNSLEFLDTPDWLLGSVLGVVLMVILIWYAVRYFQRENMAVSVEKIPMELTSFRDLGHLLDFSVLTLLITPSAWEHHYVIAIPLAIWVVVLRGRDIPWHVLLACSLVFLLPVYNVYPFSYLRLAGLIWLLILASPKRIETRFGFES
ncbi:MAG: DUF2029 domain-containing protein [Anaerolineales bacterium]|nr:DUF2029 domain-containing protein [Anaerolineales bacterium]